ncbi:MAG: pyridoxal-phosphate dependent enzyme [bacterium]
MAKRIARRRPTLLRQPVPQPRQPRGALPVDGAGDLAADRRRDRRFRGGPRDGRHHHRDGQLPQGAEALIQLIGADIQGSVYYDFWKSGTVIEPRTYLLEGIGEDFFPSTIDLAIVDRVYQLGDKECFDAARALARMEGIFGGGSCGAAVRAAIRYAEEIDRPANIVVLLPDSGCYLNKVYDDDWLRENGLLDRGGPRLHPRHAHQQVAPGLDGAADGPVRDVIAPS